MHAVVDNRNGVHNLDSKIVDIDESSALDWLRRLDGQRRTLLVFERADGVQLMVGGGSEHFISTLSDGKQNRTLKNPMGRETELIEVCAGGQYGEYPETICVTQSQAALAITLFFGGKEEQADWV